MYIWKCFVFFNYRNQANANFKVVLMLIKKQRKILRTQPNALWNKIAKKTHTKNNTRIKSGVPNVSRIWPRLCCYLGCRLNSTQNGLQVQPRLEPGTFLLCFPREVHSTSNAVHALTVRDFRRSYIVDLKVSMVSMLGTFILVCQLYRIVFFPHIYVCCFALFYLYTNYLRMI